MEYTKAELKVVITNLRRKEEEDPNCRHTLSEFLTRSNTGSGQAPARSIAEQYSPGDLVILEQHSSVGLILQLQFGSLKVLTDRNKIEMVKISQVAKRIAFETRGVSGRHIKRRAPVVMDKYHNTVSLRTIVKPIVKG